MNIGIITFHEVNNYGAILQAVALQIKLEMFGKSQIINYLPDIETTIFTSVTQNGVMDKQISNIMLSLLSDNNKTDINNIFDPIERVCKFRNFIEKYFNLTKPYSYKELMSNRMKEFDVYVSGSDQIWNPRLANMDPVFFSYYAPANAKKISYASSTGDYAFNDEQKLMIKKYLSNFSYISTREESTVDILKNITGKEVELVLDPTLLLNKKEWKENFNITKDIKEPYMLVYSMSRESNIFEIAYSIAKKKGLKIYNIRNWESSADFIRNREYFDKFFANAGPDDFLNLFYNASFVVTDSFHGSIFSINFNKPFIAIKPKLGGGRLTSILKMLHLENRLVYSLEELNKFNNDFDIDYESVNNILNNQREKSMTFLEKALND